MNQSENFRIALHQSGFLRFATPDDAERLALWWSDGQVMEHAGFPDGINTNIEDLKKRLSKLSLDRQLWIIEDYTKQPIGEMNHKVNEGTATIGIKICEASQQGKGIGKRALKAMIIYLFDTLNVEKIWLDTMIENTRAQHVYRSLLFSEIAVRKDIWKDQTGRLRTSVEFILTKEVYQKNQSLYND